MREAVIVSTARTPIGKAYRGAFNDTQAQTLGGHAIANALQRASVDPGEVDDVVMGAAMQQGSQGGNVARQALLRAGLPTSVAGMSLDRQCASGLMAIATAAKEIIDDGMSVTIGGGAGIHFARPERQDEPLSRFGPLARRASRRRLHDDDRDGRDRGRALPGHASSAQDEYALQSQQRTAAAQAAGRFDAEIAPLATVMKVTDKATGAVSDKPVTLEAGRGPRADTTLAGLSALKPVFADGQRIKAGSFITAGNASQLSDGASACVLMDGEAREPAQPRSRSGSIAASPSPAAIRTRWASVRSSPCRSCSRRTASRSTTSASGS